MFRGEGLSADALGFKVKDGNRIQSDGDKFQKDLALSLGLDWTTGRAPTDKHAKASMWELTVSESRNTDERVISFETNGLLQSSQARDVGKAFNKGFPVSLLESHGADFFCKL